MPFDHAGHLCGMGKVNTWHRCSPQPTLQLIPALITMLAGSDLASESSTQGSRRPQQLIRIGTRIESVGSSCLARAAESHTSPLPWGREQAGGCCGCGSCPGGSEALQRAIHALVSFGVSAWSRVCSADFRVGAVEAERKMDCLVPPLL